MAPRLTADDKKWRAQSDLRTLAEADAIRADKTRMAAVQSQAQSQMATLSRVAGPKAAAKKGK